MSGSIGPRVAVQTSSLFVNVVEPPGHSPEILTSFALGARSRNVTERSGWISGETSAEESRRGAVFVEVEGFCAKIVLSAKATGNVRRNIFIAICAFKPLVNTIQLEN